MLFFHRKGSIMTIIISLIMASMVVVYTIGMLIERAPADLDIISQVNENSWVDAQLALLPAPVAEEPALDSVARLMQDHEIVGLVNDGVIISVPSDTMVLDLSDVVAETVIENPLRLDASLLDWIDSFESGSIPTEEDIENGVIYQHPSEDEFTYLTYNCGGLRC